MLSKGEAGSWDEAGVGSPVVGGALKEGRQRLGGSVVVLLSKGEVGSWDEAGVHFPVAGGVSKVVGGQGSGGG